MNYKDRVNKYYYEHKKVSVDNVETPLFYYEKENREQDSIYNDPNAKYQIYTIGCCWTYGWGVEQNQTFTHLLGDKDTAVYNYGVGSTGIDFATRTISQLYDKNVDNQIFIITIPHLWVRTWFNDDGEIYKSWRLYQYVDINDSNNYFNFLHHYELINNFVGKDKIIWGCFGGNSGDILKLNQQIGDKVDVTFDLIDVSDDKLHPGPKSHKKYAEKLKDVLQNRFK